MIDMQNQPDDRQIAIDQVGVSDLRYPITVLDRQAVTQHTVATIAMSVGLPHHFKGTHMSRFIEVLNEHRGEVTLRTLPALLRDLLGRLEADDAHIEVKFPYFIERSAPVSGAKGLMDYECWFDGAATPTTGTFTVGVRVPVTSLCPCSKAISKYGAHNQRGYVSIEVRGTEDAAGQPAFIWIEDLVETAEASASAPVYALLKRDDERFVTEQAYENPAFVEDIVRNVANRLAADERVAWFRVHVVNHESIHNHAAFARIERTCRGARPQAPREAVASQPTA